MEEYNLYKEISTIGKISGWLICGITIDLIDLTDSIILNYLIIAPIIEWILRKISYFTCGIMVKINEPSIRSLGYWIWYSIYVLILFGILSFLKNKGIIPVVTNLDMKIFNCIVNLINNMLMSAFDDIIERLQM